MNLGKLFGIQFRVHPSWFLIFILVTYSLSQDYFPHEYPGWDQMVYWVMGIATSLLFFSSVIAHELAHSLVSRINGIPVKSITLFIFGGVAQITREASKPGHELRMAAAGPVCSLLIGGLFAALYFVTRQTIAPVAVISRWLYTVNLMLAVFNLIPGFPLDGGRVFRSILWRLGGNYFKATRWAARVGRGVGYLFVFAGLYIVFFRPLGLTWFDGIWFAFIGWFLENAASSSYRQAGWQEALRGFKASQLMSADYLAVPPNMTISSLIEKHVLTGGHRFFLVNDETGLAGVMALEHVKALPQKLWATTEARQIMIPANRLKFAHPEQDALSVLEQMDENEIGQMVVMSEGKVVGLIARDNLIRFLQIRSELKI